MTDEKQSAGATHAGLVARLSSMWREWRRYPGKHPDIYRLGWQDAIHTISVELEAIASSPVTGQEEREREMFIAAFTAGMDFARDEKQDSCEEAWERYKATTPTPEASAQEQEPDERLPDFRAEIHAGEFDEESR